MHPNDTREIILHNGMVALVDASDYDLVSAHNWRGGRYATTSKKDKTISMHRMIMDPPEGMEVDHINGDRLDNRRANLRVVTRSQNEWNQHGLMATNTSGYIGVSLDKRGKRKRPWYAYISRNNKMIRIGYFSTAEEAARARDEKAIELRGDLATLNFPRT